MSLLGYRAFATELLKIATEVRDADIRAMIAYGKGQEYLPGGELKTNTEVETNFKPKLAVSAQWLKGHLVRGAAKATDQRLGSFTSKMKTLSSESKHLPIRAQASLSAAYGKSTLNNRRMAAHFPKTEKNASFMGYTPASTYAFRGKAPTGKSSPYETASNFAATGLKGGMTGAGVATLGHTLMHGHEARIMPKNLGKAVAIGGGVALADRALRRHAVMKQNRMAKTAMLGSNTFSPGRALQTSQQQGHFENKLHRGVVKSMPGMIGESSTPQGA